MDLEGLVRSRRCSGEGATKTSEGRRASKHSDSFERLPGRTKDPKVAPETVNDEGEAVKANEPLRSTRPQEGFGGDANAWRVRPSAT
jgi:hypothetical protein